MKVVGVTGQIGAGKSSVAELLGRMGARVLSADVIAKRLLEPESVAYQEVVDFFGPDILEPDMTVNRSKLASIVFIDNEKLETLNQIVHPRVINEMKDSLERMENDDNNDVPIVVLDVPILFGSGAENLVEKVIAVLADEKVRLKRLKAIGFDETDALARSAAQLSPAELSSRADYIIENNGSFAELKSKVVEIWSALEEDPR